MNGKLKQITTSLGVALVLGFAGNTAAHADTIPLIDTTTPGIYAESFSEAGWFSGDYEFHLGAGDTLHSLTTSSTRLSEFTAWLTGGDIVGTLNPVQYHLSTDPDYGFSAANIAFSGLSAGNYTLHISAQGAARAPFTTLISTTVSAVPEPESLALMLAGLGVMSAVARRRSAAKAA